jgi:hypothetical protein
MSPLKTYVGTYAVLVRTLVVGCVAFRNSGEGWPLSAVVNNENERDADDDWAAGRRPPPPPISDSVRSEQI